MGGASSNANSSVAHNSSQGRALRLNFPRRRPLLLVLCAAVLALFALVTSRDLAAAPVPAATPLRDRRRLPSGAWAPTLCIYVFSDTDPEYIKNLRFFVKFGMAADDGIDYIVVVQEHDGRPVCGWVLGVVHTQQPQRAGCSHVPVALIGMQLGRLPAWHVQGRIRCLPRGRLLTTTVRLVPACPQRPSLPQLPANARYLFHPNGGHAAPTLGRKGILPHACLFRFWGAAGVRRHGPADSPVTSPVTSLSPPRPPPPTPPQPNPNPTQPTFTRQNVTTGAPSAGCSRAGTPTRKTTSSSCS